MELFRKRKAKFTGPELEVLVEEVIRHHENLFGGKAKCASLSRKNALWGKILMKVNAVTPTKRGIGDLKKKWSDLKRNVREKYAEAQQYNGDTQAGPPGKPYFTNIQKRVFAIMDTESLLGHRELESSALALKHSVREPPAREPPRKAVTHVAINHAVALGVNTDSGSMELHGESQNSQNLEHLMNDNAASQNNDTVPNKETSLVPPNPQQGAPDVNNLNVHRTDEPVNIEEEGTSDGNGVRHSNMDLSRSLKDFTNQKLEDAQNQILQPKTKQCRLIGKLNKTFKNPSRGCFRYRLGIRPALNAIRLSLEKLTSTVKELSVNLEKHNKGLVEVAKSNASVLLVLSMIANREKEILEAMLNVHSLQPSSVNSAKLLAPTGIAASPTPPIVMDIHPTNSSFTSPPVVKDANSFHSSVASLPMVDVQPPHRYLTLPVTVENGHQSHASPLMREDVQPPHHSLFVPVIVENGHPPHTSKPVVEDGHTPHASSLMGEVVQPPPSCLFVPVIVEDVPPLQNSLCSPPMLMNGHPHPTLRTTLPMLETSDGSAPISGRKHRVPQKSHRVQLKKRKI